MKFRNEMCRTLSTKIYKEFCVKSLQINHLTGRVLPQLRLAGMIYTWPYVSQAVNRKLEENVWKNCSRSLHFKKLRCRVFLQLSLVEMNSTVHIVLHPLNIKLEESLRKKSVF